MAKWGKGDPRWIVEERPDATNVNNWHWTEKNADSWSKRKLEELLVGSVVEDPGVGRVEIVKMERCEGEARVNNRKAKLIFFYEWDIKLEWTGRAKGAEEVEVKGTVSVPNLSEEHVDVADVDVDVATTGDSGGGPEARLLKEMMRTGRGAEAVRARLQSYVDALKTEYGTGLILPAKDSVATGGKKQVREEEKQTSASRQMEGLQLGYKVPAPPAKATASTSATSTLEMSERFKCTGQELYNVLTQKQMLRVFTGGEVRLGAKGDDLEAAKEGEAFEMIGGNVVGSFVSLEPFTRIVQKWRLRSWPQGHFSRVEMDIRQCAEDTCLTLKQADVPEKEVEGTRQGWQRYYWEAIRRAFGFGSRIY